MSELDWWTPDMAHEKPVPSQVYRETIVDLVKAEQARTVVEIGVYSGKLSKMLAAVPCVRSLTIIDHWEEWPNKFSAEHMENLYQEVQRWADTVPKLTVLRKDSIEAASLFGPESIDLWETDGGHRYERVKGEIETWLPLMKPGGVMCGDNYEHSPLAKAVDEMLPQRQSLAKGRVWWARV
jgi:predicted O-methyltransferase YrrM